MSYRAVFFDFDGVLSSDRFYSTLADYPRVTEYVNQTIFGGEQSYADQWMRGQYTYHDINRLIAGSTDVPFELINQLFIQSVRDFTLNTELISYAKNLKAAGIPIAIITNNMDVFNEITIPTHGLDNIFDVIINSSDYGMMKHEQNGKLFEIALSQLELKSFENVLLIDDSKKACDLFEARGGSVYRFAPKSSDL